MRHTDMSHEHYYYYYLSTKINLLSTPVETLFHCITNRRFDESYMFVILMSHSFFLHNIFLENSATNLFPSRETNLLKSIDMKPQTMFETVVFELPPT